MVLGFFSETRVMKFYINTFTATVVGLCFFAFTYLEDGVIKGRVIPPEGANHAWAISATDTIETPINMGNFQFNSIKPGTYKVIINANAPYRDLIRDGVLVSDAAVVDLGDLQLQR